MTRFETTGDGIKTTSTKVSDIEGVLVEEVLSEPEQEKPVSQTDVVIEEVLETEGRLTLTDIHIILIPLHIQHAKSNKTFCELAKLENISIAI